MKKFKLNIKEFLRQANWGHEDFGTVAKFFSKEDWYVTEDQLEEINNNVSVNELILKRDIDIQREFPLL